MALKNKSNEPVFSYYVVLIRKPEKIKGRRVLLGLHKGPPIKDQKYQFSAV